jgi:NTP pyrophosphatase (non-canonical NTP hydrolase)
VREELAEVEHELAAGPGPSRHPADPDPNTPTSPSERLTDEIGDLLFAVVNLARKAGVQPGSALDRANRKFQERFEAVEELAAERGIDVATAGLETLDGLWDEAKAAGRRGSGADGPHVGDRRLSS